MSFQICLWIRYIHVYIHKHIGILKWMAAILMYIHICWFALQENYIIDGPEPGLTPSSAKLTWEASCVCAFYCF